MGGFCIESGFELTKEALNSYAEVMRGRHRYVTYKIQQGAQTCIRVAKKGKPDATFQNLLDDLPLNESRYFIYDCRFVCDNDECQPRHRIILVSWCPEDNCSVEIKVTYASSRVAVLKAFSHHDTKTNLEIVNPSDLTEELMLEKIAQPGENPLLFKEKKEWVNNIERPADWPPLPEPEPEIIEEDELVKAMNAQVERPESPESQTLVDVGEGDEGVVENAPPVTHVIHGEFIDGEYVEADMEASAIVAEALEEEKAPAREMSEVMDEMREKQQLRDLKKYMKEISSEMEMEMQDGPGVVQLDEISVQPINIQVIVPEEKPVEPVDPLKKTLKEILMEK